MKIYSKKTKSEYRKAVEYFKEMLGEECKDAQLHIVKNSTLFFRTLLLYLARKRQAVNYAYECFGYNHDFPPLSHGKIPVSELFTFKFSFIWAATVNKGEPEYYLKRYLIYYLLPNTPMTLDNYGSYQLRNPNEMADSPRLLQRNRIFADLLKNKI